ncbi:MAG: hypothetical protein ACYCUI_08640 [Vulcanimicrobiaceae bacterium]
MVKHAKNIFASVTSLALIGAPGAAFANSPPQLMHPGPALPCCTNESAQVTGWVELKTASKAPTACDAIYFKFVSSDAPDTYGRGFGNVASGKCYYKLSLAGIKHSTTGAIYMKYDYMKFGGMRGERGSFSWGVGRQIRVAPQKHVTLNYLKIER